MASTTRTSAVTLFTVLLLCMLVKLSTQGHHLKHKKLIKLALVAHIAKGKRVIPIPIPIPQESHETKLIPVPQPVPIHIPVRIVHKKHYHEKHVHHDHYKHVPRKTLVILDEYKEPPRYHGDWW